MGQEEHPKVFISYSWTSEDYKAWIRDLGTQLLEDGVEVVLDQWEDLVGDDLNAYMETMVDEEAVTHVLLVCDEAYQQKANKREGGVGTEAQIVSPNLYGTIRQERFVPIIAEKDDEGRPYLPTYLGSRMAIDLSDRQFDADYEELLRVLYRRPKHTKPDRGNPPEWLFEEDIQKADDDVDQPLATADSFSRARRAIAHAEPGARRATKNYLQALNGVLEKKAGEAEASEGELWETIEAQIDALFRYQRQFIDLVELILDYSKEGEKLYLELLGDFFESAIAPVIEDHGRVKYLDQTRFFVREAFLHTVYRLLMSRRDDALEGLLERRYFFKRSGKHLDESYTVFRQHLATLEKDKPVDRYTPTGDKLKKRCEEGLGDFGMLASAEMVLLLRGVFGGQGRWYPNALIVHCEMQLPLFFRGRDSQMRATLLRAMGVTSIDELRDQLRKHAQTLNKYKHNEQAPYDFERELCLNEWEDARLKDLGSVSF
jgi:hypothetical protein